MDDDTIQSLNDQLLADDELLGRFREDPAAVVKESGIDLNSEQEGRLLGEGWLEKTEDEVLALLRDSGLGFWL
jgi:hypothetical protein